MLSSTRQAMACVLLIFGAVASSSSQTNPEKPANGSISGKVTLKNKPVPGIAVFAEDQAERRSGRNRRGITDQTGGYRITDLPPGTYVVTPIAPSLAIEDELRTNSVVVAEDETVEGVNFSMVPGGVITGKITDADGKPLIEEYVTLIPIDSAVVSGRFIGSIRTDDRGIYRVFGLRQGRYKLFVGQDERSGGGPRPSYRQTFYPSVTDEAKAKVIEVTEGGEVTNVDIIVGRPLPTFHVSGRILDGETGKPLSNIRFGLYQRHGEHGGSSTVGRNATNARGEFRLENVSPGRYAVFVYPEDSGLRGDSVYFEVVDRDVADLVINAGKAASVSGVVVFEGAEDKGPTIKPNELYVNAWMESAEQNFSGGSSQPVKPDGSFRVSGLRQGLAFFGLNWRRANGGTPTSVVRIERDGVVQPRGLMLKDGEQVTGLRLFVRYLTGAIRGQVNVEGDELLPDSRLSVWINRIDENRPGIQYMPAGGSSPQLDSRRRFMMQGLEAGTYEVNVAVFEPGRQDTNRIYKQQVTVADNTVSDVTVTVKTKP